MNDDATLRSLFLSWRPLLARPLPWDRMFWPDGHEAYLSLTQGRIVSSTPVRGARRKALRPYASGCTLDFVLAPVDELSSGERVSPEEIGFMVSRCDAAPVHTQYRVTLVDPFFPSTRI